MTWCLDQILIMGHSREGETAEKSQIHTVEFVRCGPPLFNYHFFEWDQLSSRALTASPEKNLPQEAKTLICNFLSISALLVHPEGRVDSIPLQ